MDWIEFESVRLTSPLFADELVWCEAVERLQTPAKVVGVDEVLKVPAQLIVVVIVEALDGGVFDGPVHPFHLAIRPRMVDLGEPVLDAVLVADAIEDVVKRLFVAGMVGELDAVVRQHGVNGVGHSGNQVAQELSRDPLAGFLV